MYISKSCVEAYDTSIIYEQGYVETTKIIHIGLI